MSVRVNLIPGDVKARGQANRSRLGALALGLVLLLILGGVWFMQRTSINDAEARLTAVQAQNAALQADITALQPFADLEARANDSVEVVALALGTEGALAPVLQDLSAVLPPNAELESLVITLSDQSLQPSPGGDRLVYGRLNATGRVIDGVAPGVERLIIDLDRVAGFDNAYVTASTVDEEGVATFAIELDLGPEVLSGRYVLPEVSP